MTRDGPWPLDGFDRLRRDLDRLASDVWGEAETRESVSVWAPPVDIHEEDGALVLLVDLPGLSRDEIDLRVDAESVTIRGARSRPDGGGEIRLERPMGSFRRSFRIGVLIDPSAVEASYREGVLQVRIPMAASRGPARVQVSVE